MPTFWFSEQDSATRCRVDAVKARGNEFSGARHLRKTLFSDCSEQQEMKSFFQYD
jgi:hypothetical protein